MSSGYSEFDLLLIAGLAILLICNLLLTAYIFHKVRRHHLIGFELRDEMKKFGRRLLPDMFQNLQALDALAYELEMERPLPPVRGWAASPDVLLVLARHAKQAKPKSIVECGSGVSTVILARCCQLNGSGHVHSLDHDPDFAGKTRDLLSDYGLSSWATVFDAPLRQHDLAGETLPWYAHECLPEDLEIDMLVVDGPPNPLGPLIRYPAGPLLIPKLGPRGGIFLDDTIRDGERQAIDRWMRKFPGFQRREYPCEKGCTALFGSPPNP